MKRSSAILLWISLYWSACGIVFGIGVGILFYHLLHQIPAMSSPDPDAHWVPDSSTIAVGWQPDFASGVTVHVSWGGIACLIPSFAWLFVWFNDRPALRKRLGRVATWSGLLYLVIALTAVVWAVSLPISD